MVEYSLDDLGVPKKTGKNPIEGAKKGNEILNDFSDDNNPVLKYEEEEVKKKSSKAFADFQEDYKWFESHLEKIGKYCHSEFGQDKLLLDSFFVSLNHDCIQTDFPHENTILNCHFNNPAEFAFYFTSTINNEAKSFDKKDLVKSYLHELWDYIPENQLKHINRIVPKFISNYTIDSDPHISIEVCLDFEGIQENGGMYSDLFVQKKKIFPFFPFQPFYGGKTKETMAIILQSEEIFDIEDFVKKIADRIGRSPKEIQVEKVQKFEIAIDDLRYSTNPQAIKEMRIQYKEAGEISDTLYRYFMGTSMHNMRAIQQCAASDFVKGKNNKEMTDGLVDRLLDSYRNPMFTDLKASIFSPPEERIYFDDNISRELIKDFEGYKLNRL